MRAFRPDDAATILGWALDVNECRFWAGLDARPTRIDFSRWHADPDVHPYVATMDGHVAGYGEVWVDAEEREIELARILIAPDRRRRGLGVHVVHGLLEEAAPFGFPVVFVRVVQANTIAVRCYEKAGFRVVSPVDAARYNEGQPHAYVWLTREVTTTRAGSGVRADRARRFENQEERLDMDAETIIRTLKLRPHPKEGGFYRETYRSSSTFAPGPPFSGTRSTSTGIYYLLTPDTYSSMHRLPGDEMFHFYLGDPVEMLMLHPDGQSEVVVLGADPTRMRLQHVVPARVWQGCRLVAGGSWALMGTTMAPGFDFTDYEAGYAESLTAGYPTRRSLIEALAPKETDPSS